jgi:glycosyltransferase involved in cell wall biosynthesis
VSDHSGLAEVAAGLGDAARTFDGTAGDLEQVMGELLALPETDRRGAGLRGRNRVLERWSWERVAERLLSGIPQNGEGTSP